MSKLSLSGLFAFGCACLASCISIITQMALHLQLEAKEPYLTVRASFMQPESKELYVTVKHDEERNHADVA